MVASPPRRETAIAVLVVNFPNYSETFITGEVLRLRDRGIDARPVALARSRHAAREIDHETLARLRREGPVAPHNLTDFSLRSLPPKLGALGEALRHPIAAARLAIANRRLPINSAWPKRTRFEAALLLRRWLRREGVDGLHCHWTLPSDVALLLKAVDGTPFSLSIHAGDLYDDPRETGSEVLRRKLREAELVVTCSGRNRTFLTKLAPECASKVQLVYHGVDLGSFDGRRRPRDDRRPLVLSVGRLVDQKRFELLVRACRRARDAGIGFGCVIVGDGPHRSGLEQLCATLGLGDCVTFEGALEPPAVRDWLSRADLFVLAPDPRTHYGIPNVFLEAMAMGVPVLATRLPGLDELEGAGVFVDSDSELDTTLISLLRDRRSRIALAGQGREIVARRFDAERWADRLAQLLTGALLDRA